VHRARTRGLWNHATGKSKNLRQTVPYVNWKSRPLMKAHANPAQEQSCRSVDAHVGSRTKRLSPNDRTISTKTETSDYKRLS